MQEKGLSGESCSSIQAYRLVIAFVEMRILTILITHELCARLLRVGLLNLLGWQLFLAKIGQVLSLRHPQSRIT